MQRSSSATDNLKARKHLLPPNVTLAPRVAALFNKYELSQVKIIMADELPAETRALPREEFNAAMAVEAAKHMDADKDAKIVIILDASGEITWQSGR